jgi:hypothetical protein
MYEGDRLTLLTEAASAIPDVGSDFQQGSDYANAAVSDKFPQD